MAVEGGAFNTPEFKEFAKGVVLYMGITARIEGRKDDNLIFEKGGRGWPHIVFMDTDGSVLAVQPGAQRTVEGFQKVLDNKVRRYVDLRAKAQAGDPAAQIDFAMLRCDLGQMSFEDLQKEIAGKPLTDEQKTALKAVEAGAVLAAAKKMMEQGRGDRETFRAAAKTLADAQDKGLVPEEAERRQEFYSILFNYGMLEEDPDLAEKSLAGVRAALTEMLGDISRFEASFKAAEDKIAELRAKQQGPGEDEGGEEEEGIEEGED